MAKMQKAFPSYCNMNNATKRILRNFSSYTQLSLLMMFSFIFLHQLFTGISVPHQYSQRFELISHRPAPIVLNNDMIYMKWKSPFVIEEYKLIFFTFPKVACSEWKRMFMRIEGNENWCKIEGFNAHNLMLSGLKTLADYDVKEATHMMTSPEWTRAAFFREPKERVLSAFLDKSHKEQHYFTKRCCAKLPVDESERCKANLEVFESFLYFVTKYPDECFDIHWEPQMAKIDVKWWPFINFIGYQNNLRDDSYRLMKMLTSSKDQVKGRTLYDRYGSSGWGSEHGCENRTKAFLEENTSSHKLNSGDHLKEWYTAESEMFVEQHWSLEWEREQVVFDKVLLFPERNETFKIEFYF